MNKYELINKDSSYSGMYRVKVFENEGNIRVYIPGISQINPFDSNGNLIEDIVNQNISAFPIAQWCAYNLESCDLANISEPMWCMFEGGDVKRPVIISYTFPKVVIEVTVYVGGSGGGVSNGDGASGGSVLASSVEELINTDLLDLKHLTVSEIEKILNDNFKNATWKGNSSIFKDKNLHEVAQQIYNAQKETGLSAIVSLSIGALESAYGASNIARDKNNLYGWNATNTNTYQNASTFSSNMYESTVDFNNKLLSTYYYGRDAHTLSEIGDGRNSAGKGYAYHNNGTIDTEWDSSVGSIGNKFLNSLKE